MLRSLVLLAAAAGVAWADGGEGSMPSCIDACAKSINTGCDTLDLGCKCSSLAAGSLNLACIQQACGVAIPQQLLIPLQKACEAGGYATTGANPAQTKATATVSVPVPPFGGSTTSFNVQTIVISPPAQAATQSDSGNGVIATGKGGSTTTGTQKTSTTKSTKTGSQTGSAGVIAASGVAQRQGVAFAALIPAAMGLLAL